MARASLVDGATSLNSILTSKVPCRLLAMGFRAGGAPD